MTRVTSRAVPDRSILVRLAYAVATGTPAFRCRRAFDSNQRVGRTLDGSRLELLPERNLFGRKILVAGYRGPRCRGVPAMKKLLVNRFVTIPAIRRGYAGVDHEPVVVRSLLPLRNLVAIQAIDILPGMAAHFEFVHYRILRVQMAFGAFAAGPHKSRTRLLYDHSRPARIHKVSGQYECRGNCDRDKDGAEIHRSSS